MEQEKETRTFEELSNEEWIPAKPRGQFTDNQQIIGCLQRIANALETIAKTCKNAQKPRKRLGP